MRARNRRSTIVHCSKYNFAFATNFFGGIFGQCFHVNIFVHCTLTTELWWILFKWITVMYPFWSEWTRFSPGLIYQPMSDLILSRCTLTNRIMRDTPMALMISLRYIYISECCLIMFYNTMFHYRIKTVINHWIG